MKREFIPYEEALALKELGFDYCCFTSYSKNGQLLTDTYGNCYGVTPSNYIVAPLYQQAFRWFREEHSLRGTPTFSNYFIIFNMVSSEYGVKNSKKYSFYEEAELACLRKLIEIVRDEQND